MSEGQELAVRQLQEIEAAGTALEIKEVKRPDTEGGTYMVAISVDCRLHRQVTREERVTTGLPLRDREPFILFIPPDFPFTAPEVNTDHDRFAGFHHVQWRRHLCLYLSKEVEWIPSDGMYGFLDRLDIWLRAGALDKLDPVEQPLHPPVAYASHTSFVVPTVNAPTFEGDTWWAGEITITGEFERATFLGQWRSYADDNELGDRSACAILLSQRMPFEYPSTFRDLIKVLEDRRVSVRTIRLVLTLSAATNSTDKPLFFLLGSPMRRDAENAEAVQHLACWHITAERAAELREHFRENRDLNHDEKDTRFRAWAETAALEWCYVREQRPEIVIRRDANTPAEWWKGKTVSLLGCGAIGSTVAMLLARAGVAKLHLFDKDTVKPGIGVRQIFDRHQVGYTKVSTTRNNVRYINPEVVIGTEGSGDIRRVLQTQPEQVLDCDIIINATASGSVALALENHFSKLADVHPPLISLSLGHAATYGMVTLTDSASRQFPHDLERRLKIALTTSMSGKEYLDEFWPTRLASRKPFQPEPGCSEPTFVGSAADVMSLTASMLNVSAAWMRENTRKNRAFVMRAPHIIRPGTEAPSLSYSWGEDRFVTDTRKGFSIRLAGNAERDIISLMNASIRKRGRTVETGGLLFGEVDDLLKIIWLSDVSGPPPDSIHSPVEFTCGFQGTRELHTEKRVRTRGSVQYIGMWHTHPGGPAQPSPTDVNAMRLLSRAGEMAARQFLMLIVGGHQPNLHFGGHVFGRDEF